MRILAIDDEEFALLTLKKAIEKAVAGAEIDAFTSSVEALASAKKTVYDIAFSDVRMPELHGVELAKSLKKTNPKMNIIFVTGFDEFKDEAIKLHASGYIKKPVSAEDIRKEMENLLNPVEIPTAEVFIRTFGDFAVFVNGQPVTFSNKKNQEYLAYLVDRHGAAVSKKQMANILFDDENYSLSRQNYISNIAKHLYDDLLAAKIEHIMKRSFGSTAVDPSKFKCDAYEYLAGHSDALNRFSGEYMEQYSWAEASKGKFFE